MDAKHALGWWRAISLAIIALGIDQAAAQTPMQRYLAARDRYIAQANVLVPQIKDHRDYELAHQKLALPIADLRRQLSAMIGPVAVAGFAPQADITHDILYTAGVGDAIDGLSYYGLKSNKDHPHAELRVTTTELAQNWLDHYQCDDCGTPGVPAIPRDLSAAMTSEFLFSNESFEDTRVYQMIDLPVHSPPSAMSAYAMLSQRTNDWALYPPNEIDVSVRIGKLILFADQGLSIDIQPVPECTRIVDDVYQKTKTQVKDYDQIIQTGIEKFRSCYRRHLVGSREMHVMTKQAQALIDDIAAGVKPR